MFPLLSGFAPAVTVLRFPCLLMLLRLLLHRSLPPSLRSMADHLLALTCHCHERGPARVCLLPGTFLFNAQGIRHGNCRREA